MRKRIYTVGGLFRASIEQFIDHDCAGMAAAIAYYAVFAIPAFLLLVTAIGGAVLDEQAVQSEITAHIYRLFGPQVAGQVPKLLQGRPGWEPGGPLAATLGGLALIAAATGAFTRTQSYINEIWCVGPIRGRSFLRYFFTKRALSFLLILLIASLLLVSVAINGVMSVYGERLMALPGFPAPGVFTTIYELASVGILTFVFAVMFKLLPDAKVAWRDVWIGAIVTSTLSALGKLGVGFYLGHSQLASIYGAAGSLAVILLWTYYSASIFFFGVTFTKVWSMRHGGGIKSAFQDKECEDRSRAVNTRADL